jgi:menaquinone-9 beta-reductase
MENHQVTAFFDVIIVGAGPAGCTCALALRNSNLKVALFDKSSFPRDKVCGDAIPTRAIKTLKSISPEFASEFSAFHQKCGTTKSKIFYQGKQVDFEWSSEAYTCARIDFDNFLLSLVKKHTETELYENTSLTEVSIENNYVYVKESGGRRTFGAKIIIGADGAHSIVAKQLAGRTLDRKHYVGAVRGYYHNIIENQENTTELFLIKNLMPSYLWIFPLPENKANVGFGMLSSDIAKRKLNLRKTFQELLKETPELARRFSGASLLGEVEGSGLPLGSKRVKISGDNFILIGDAASLIDPISGQGIGNAMFSGKLAAEQIIKCFSEKNFSGDFIKAYDKNLFKALGTELKTRTFSQQVAAKMPFLVDWYFFLTRNAAIRRFFQKIIG